MTDSLRSAACALTLLALVVPTAHAQADSDGDGVPNALELSGYVFDVPTGAIVACDPATASPCYVTDPLSWSSDGDPYSDFQEASGVNMDATVAVPYNSPLVAAYPVIEVSMNRFTFTSNATITDSNGRMLTTGSSITNSFESTTSASVTVGASYSISDGFGVSAEATASYSETTGYAGTQTSGTALNWETATTTQFDDAGTLSLSLFARNTGGATALNVRPTFNVYIGPDLVATVLPDAPFRQSLAPGEASAPVVPIVNGTPLAVQLSFARLQALQLGAPVTIEVVDILADIQRWRPQDSNWECGTGETCEWTSFQNQILPRTLRLLVDFGYSGDPDVTPPFEFAGNPYEFRVYAGSPSASPGFTLRDVLELAAFEVAGPSSDATIEGRPYPSAWVLNEQRVGGVARIEQAWIGAGRPQNLLDVVMPRQATLFMTSPAPDAPGVALRQSTLSRDMLGVRAYALPRGGLPIMSARAVLQQNGVYVEVPMTPAPSGAYWTTEDAGVPLLYPIGAATSYVEFTDLLGAVQRSSGALTLPIEPAATCADVPPGDLVDVVGTGGRATLFPSGDLDRPVEVYCDLAATETRYWVPQPDLAAAGTSIDPNEVATLSDTTAIAVGQGLVRSDDGGRSWRAVPGVPAGTWVDIDHRTDTGTVLVVGSGPGGNGILRSPDGGHTWVTIPFPLTSFGSDVAHAGGGTWFVIAQGSPDRLLRSVDDGLTWTAVALPRAPINLTDMAFRDALTGIVLDGGTVGTAGTGRTWRTTDGGQTWVDVLGATGARSVVYAGNDSWYLAQKVGATAPSRVVRSRDDGASGSWTIFTLPVAVSESPSAMAFATPDVGYMLDVTGLLRTSDGGATWTREPYVPQTDVLGLAVFDVNRAIAVGLDFRRTPNRLLAQLTTSGGAGVMIVGDEPAPVAATSVVTLEAPRPNPFRGRTELAFTLDAPADAALAVYDLLGREVARLADGPHAAGEHRVAFDATGLAAGVYVARLVTGEQAVVRRLTIVR